MTQKPELKYIPGLDALRGIACLSVLLFHSNFVTKTRSPYVPFKGGALGVDLFFVLSGFLITTILLNQFAKDSTISFRNFYFKRILRLYPPILISVVVFLLPLLFTDRLTAISNIVSLLTYTGDVFMVVQHFIHLPYPLLSSQSWSLAVEEQFYITYPLLLFWVLRLASRKKRSNLIGSFPLFVVIYFGVVIVSTMILGNWFYKFFLWRFFEIYLGAFVAVIYSEAFRKIATDSSFSGRIRSLVQTIYGNKIVLVISMLYLLGELVYPNQMPFENYVGLYNLHYIFVTFAASVLIANIAFPQHEGLLRLFSNKALIWLGTISYGLYLYTPFIQQMVDKFIYHGNPFSNATDMLISDGITIAGGLLFSYLSFTLIEKNVLKLKHRLEPQDRSLAPNPEMAMAPVRRPE